MEMLESKAMEKWCPSAVVAIFPQGKEIGISGNRFRAPDHATSNRNYLNPPEARCIGGQCMGWRWTDEQNKTGICAIAHSQQKTAA